MWHLDDIAARILADEFNSSPGLSSWWQAIGRDDLVIGQVGNIVHWRFASQSSNSWNLLNLWEELLDNPNASENDKMVFISNAQMQLWLRRVYFSWEALIIVLRDIWIDIWQHWSIYDALYNGNSVDVAVKVLLIALRGESINQRLGELNTELADNYFLNLKEKWESILSTWTNEEKINFIETFFWGNKNSFWYKVSEKLARMYNPNDFFQIYRRLYEKLLNYKSNPDSQNIFIELIILFYENKWDISKIKIELERKESELKEQAEIDWNNQSSSLRLKSLEVLEWDDNNAKIQICYELIKLFPMWSFLVNVKNSDISNETYSIVSRIFFYYVQHFSWIRYSSDFPERFTIRINQWTVPYFWFNNYFGFNNIFNTFIWSDETKMLNTCIKMLIIFLDSTDINSVNSKISDLNASLVS